MTFAPAYLAGLDGIRGYALIGVCALHARVPGSEGAWIGLEMFFVLSGYLITLILANEMVARGSVNVPAFYLRRARRIYPPLVTMLLAYALLAPVAWPDYPYAEVAKAILGGLTYTTNYTLDLYEGPRYAVHLWSLSVEAHFYLAWALLLPLILRSRRPLHILFGLYIAATAIRFLCVDLQGEAAFNFSHSRMSGLMLGSLLGVALHTRSVSPALATGAGYLGVTMVIAMMVSGREVGESSIREVILFAEIAALGLIVWSTVTPRLLTHPVVVRLGVYSYGAYLWHYPIMRWLRPDHPWWVTFIVGFGGGLAAAALSYHTIEAYFLRRRSMGVPA